MISILITTIALSHRFRLEAFYLNTPPLFPTRKTKPFYCYQYASFFLFFLKIATEILLIANEPMK